ncbi:hypothetical protein PsorP6_014328 [Peronosclerospora sorghi]|uniref:Uncharacterized protein n=1 Tax=Peronosclerospora sorghi TaxID=230839 RepID=A0ACC0VFQ9_9STRA|nr:hypothetical protein PsorP6_014328 [Peronosclerospora sorghi]
MEDSQNWSSFDESTRRKEKKKTVQSGEMNGVKKGKGVNALMEPVALRHLRNRLVFGSLVGFLTGATFGGIDGARLYMKQNGKLAPAALSTVARGAAVTGGSFSGYGWTPFTVTAMATQREDDVLNAGISAVAAGLPFVRSVVMRQNLPYALMLVALDHFHEELSEFRT